MDALPQLSLDVYLLQEFRAMDIDNRHYLNTKQFCDLLKFLGYDHSPENVRMKMKEMDSDGDAIIRQTDYVDVMTEDKELLEGTRFWRDIFMKADKDSNGYALTTDFIKEGGFFTPAMSSRFSAMDSNHDGFISYEDFLKVLFQGKDTP